MLLNTKELLKSLKVAKKYSEKKDLSKITANVFFMLEDGELMLKASNGETGISLNLGEIANAFNFDVRLVDLLDFVTGCSGDNIEFLKDGPKISLKSEESNITLEMYEVAQMDLESYMDEELKRSSGAREISGIIEINESIFKTIDKNNPKTELNGMLLDLKNKKIVATDARRLSVSDIHIDYKGIAGQVIIPKSALQDVKSIADIRISKNYISFKDGDKKITSRLIKGKYPEYKRIVPSDYNFIVKVNGMELKNILKKIKSGDITLSFANNTMQISTFTGISMSMECYYPSKNIFKISLNKIHLQDAILENDLKLCFNDKNIPFTVSQNNGKNKTVIMPIVVEETIYDVGWTKEDFNNSTEKFIYKEQTKKRKPPINKDKIIRDLQKEVVQLQEKLKGYEDKKSIVKHEVFNNIFESAKTAGGHNG